MALKNIPAILLFCLFGTSLVAQTNPHDYADAWKKIDSLINKKGLAQSALREVNIIYHLAKKENNEAQVLKALLTRMDLQEKTQEDAFEINVHDLQNEMKTTTGPAAAILKSLLAGTYWNYFQQNRYKFYDRTSLSNTKNDDPATWTIDEFHKNIGSLYTASLANMKQLQQTRLEPFDAIIVKGNVRWLRPTLFDLLAHRALEYFKNEERNISEPEKNFEINAPEAFADISVFIYYHFKTPDSTSLQFKALQLFQQLLAFHAADPKPDALIDVDIERLEFVQQYSVLENRDELYGHALEKITAKYGDLPAAAQAWYLQALAFSLKAGTYDPLKDTSNRYAYLPCKAICEKVIAEKDSSEGKTNCLNLLNQILAKEIRLQTERVNIPGQPFRTLVNYRNCNLLHIRILKMDPSLQAFSGNYPADNIEWKKLLQAPVFRSFNRQLPETNDYQEHAVEIKMDALTPGEYMLLASVKDDFSMDKNLLAVEYFYVSNIAFIDDGDNYFVLNRETGQPLAKASVQLWSRYIENKTGKYRFEKAGSFQSDSHGYFCVNTKDFDWRSAHLLEITTDSDRLFLKEPIHPNTVYFDTRVDESVLAKKDYEKDNLKVFLFTDRSIYRPGQTIFFKGIVVTKDFDTKQSKIIPGFKTKLILYDANQQKIDSLQLTSNEFGSYHGKFILPGNLLDGNWKIADDSSGNEQSFSVEEYKRPKFYIGYEKLEGSYRLNDSIRVIGIAKAFAGNAIGSAHVKFRVNRMARFVYPSLLSRRIEPNYISQEIAHGELNTDTDGKFNIDFIAVPDNSINKSFDPVFDYEISSDITDINGETRSASTMVSVGYQSLLIYIDKPASDDLPADSLKDILIKSTNFSGEFEQATVKLAVFSLHSPDRLIRARFWQQPDHFVMSREEYLKNFPHDEYSDETKKETWEKTGKVYEQPQLPNSRIRRILVAPFFYQVGT